MQIFFTWFKSHNGQLDASSMDVIQFPASQGGRGAVALRDIPVSLKYLLSSTVFTLETNYLLFWRKAMSYLRYPAPWFYRPGHVCSLRNLDLTHGRSPACNKVGPVLSSAWCGKRHKDLSQNGLLIWVGRVHAKRRRPILTDLWCSLSFYFFKDILPKSFDTPVFWGEDDLAELKGTCVVGWFLLFFLHLPTAPYSVVFMKLTHS